MSFFTKIKISPVFFLIFVFAFLTSPAFAGTSEYQIIRPESKEDINFSQNSYNEIGELKITASENFDINQRVILTINYDKKFINTDDTAQTVAYNLVLETSDSYIVLNDGDKIEFSAASIDNNIGITLGAIITEDTSELSDGDYKNEINFTAVTLPVVGTTSYMFGNYIWRVLSYDEISKCALLVTNDCVEKMKFGKISINTWASSAVREWLNDENKFFKSFSDEEKTQILNVKIEDETAQNKNSSEIIDPFGEDKIFLLSSLDVYTYFSEKSKRIAEYEGESVKWWLRSPAKNSSTNVIYVNTDGSTILSGYGAYDDRYVFGVRPALWLDLSASEEKHSSIKISFIKGTESENNDNDNAGSNEDNNNDNENNDSDSNNDDDNDEDNNNENENHESENNNENNSESKYNNSENDNKHDDEKIDNNEQTQNEDNEKNNNDEVLNNNVPSEPEKISTDELKNLDEDVVSGDIGETNSEEIIDLIKKLENATDLKVLDLYNISGLKEIFLPPDTKIEELNIGNCNALLTIDVSNSFLKKININGCPKLIALNCESCNLVELDINNCDELLDLNCSYNSLTRLNISGLKLKKLSSLKCDHQSINNINIVENFNFFDFLFRLNSEIFTANYTKELYKIKDLKAFDENGDAIYVNLNLNNGNITFAAAPATIKYNYETGFNNILMDVTVNTTAGKIKNEDKNSDTSNEANGGGGCNLVGVNRFFIIVLLSICVTKKI